MEIRPYRSQVRETATREPLERPNTAMAQTYAAYGDMVSRAGDTVSSSLYKWNDAIEKRKDQDRKIAYQAGVQEMDVLFAELGKAMNDDMAKREQDPFSVFDADTKNALNEIYSYHVNLIKDKTVGRAADPDTKAMLDLYFRAKKLEAGASVETAIKAHTDNVAATVMGKANAGLVEAAIAGDEKDIDTSMKGIKQNLDILAERGVITKAQIADNLKGAKDQIEFGRAKNQIDALDYKTGQEFVNQVPVNDETRKNLQTYFKDRWDRQKHLILQQQGEAYNQGIDLYNNGQLTREWVDTQAIFETRPEIGINTDYRTFFRGLFDAKDKQAEAKSKAEKSDAAYRNYFNQIDVIQKGDDTPEDKQAKLNKLWEKIKQDPELDQKTDVERLAGFMGVKPGSAKTSGSGGGAGYEADLNEFYEILFNRASSLQVKREQFAEFFPRFVERHPDAGEKLSWFNSMVEHSDELALPEIKALQDAVESKIQAYRKNGDYESEIALSKASQSFFQTVAETMWWKTDKDGKRVETSEPERLKIFNDAKEKVTLLLGKGDVLDALDGYNISTRHPQYKKVGNGYSMTVDGEYDDMREAISSGRYFQYTPQGRDFFGQIEMVDKEAIGYTTGEDMSNYRMVIVDNNPYYYDKDTNKAFTVARNERGDWNVYRVVNDGSLWKQTPPIIKKELDLAGETSEQWNPAGTFVSKVGTGEISNKEAAEKAGEAVVNAAKTTGKALNTAKKYVVEKTQGKR